MEMWIGRPVRVERTSLWANDLCPVKRRNSVVWPDIVAVALGLYFGVVVWQGRWMAGGLVLDLDLRKFWRVHR